MVKITRDAMLFIETVENGEDVTVDILKTENGIVSYLDQYIMIEEDVTVDSLLKLLGEVEEEIDYVFDAALNGNTLGVFLTEAAGPSTHDGALAFVEVVHDVDLGSDQILNEIKYFQGIGPSPIDGRLTSFTLELLPLSYYKDMVIVLNHNYVVQRIDNHAGIPMHFVEFKARKGFTLYEVIYAILYEISFHGSPDERNRILQDILAMCESVNTTGEQLALPVAAASGKEAEQARLKAELERVLAAEDYEKAVIIRDKLKDLMGDR